MDNKYMAINEYNNNNNKQNIQSAYCFIVVV